MESGGIAFKKPGFEDDAASELTDVPPDQPVPHHDATKDGQQNVEPGVERGANDHNVVANQETEATKQQSSSTSKDTDSETKTEEPLINPFQQTRSKDDSIEPTPQNGTGPNRAETGEISPTANRVHLHRINEKTPDRHMNPRARNNVQFANDGKDPELGEKDGTGEAWAARSDRVRRNSSIRRPSEVKTGVMETKLGFWRTVRYTAWDIIMGFWTMFSTFPYWDMAFWSSWAYSIGSCLFIVVGAWEWAPTAFPNSEFSGEEKGSGILFFIGAILYEFGATMAYLEAINDGSFAGTGMKRFLEGNDEYKKSLLDEKLHRFFGHIIPHHHDHDEDPNELEKEASVDPEAGWRTLTHEEEPPDPIYPDGVEPPPRRVAVDHGEAEKEGNHEYLTWQWYATWKSFTNYHIKQPGYVACSIQLFGATWYAIDGVVALPGVTDGFTHSWQTLAASWIPAVLGSICFITASIIFTLITQERWYRPAPWKLSWWIGIWAGIGSMGFLLNSLFGIASLYCASWTSYQSSLCTLWGSAGYLFSALLQWYESVNKGPVLAFPNNRIPSMLR